MALNGNILGSTTAYTNTTDLYSGEIRRKLFVETINSSYTPALKDVWVKKLEDGEVYKYSAAMFNVADEAVTLVSAVVTLANTVDVDITAVKDTAGTTTFDFGLDYTFTDVGVLTMVATGSITLSANLAVTYEHNSDRYETLGILDNMDSTTEEYNLVISTESGTVQRTGLGVTGVDTQPEINTLIHKLEHDLANGSISVE